MNNHKNIPGGIRKGLNARLEAMSTFGENVLKSPALGPISNETEDFKLSRQAVESCSPYIRMIGTGPVNSLYVMSGMFNTEVAPDKFSAIDSDIKSIQRKKIILYIM